MASWEDGPEYAPVERPSGFTAPTAKPLDVAPKPLDVAPKPLDTAAPPTVPAPPTRPADYHTSGPERPLESYQPALGPSRDPGEPFAMARSTMTEVDSAWGLVHHYHVDAENWPPPGGPPLPDPRAPIRVQGTGPSPSVSTGPGQGPELLPPGPVPPSGAYPAEHPVTFGAVFNAVTVPTFATLLIGGLALAVPFFSWLSPLMFILAFATATQISYRRNWVRNTFLVASGALGATLVSGVLLSGGNLSALLDLIAAVSTATCWIVLASLMVIVWQALSNGEQPELPGPIQRGWG
jgi:hypothetical protein